MKAISIVYNRADFTIKYERKEDDGIIDYTVYFDDFALSNLFGSPFKFHFAPKYNRYPLFDEGEVRAYDIAAAILKADGFENVLV